jgi:hypothetical protein
VCPPANAFGKVVHVGTCWGGTCCAGHIHMDMQPRFAKGPPSTINDMQPPVSDDGACYLAIADGVVGYRGDRHPSKLHNS